MMKAPLVIALLGVIGGLLQFSIHKVEEGHVGVYWRGGALINRVTEPGLHLKLPFLDAFENV